jgi:hypothetical protein
MMEGLAEIKLETPGEILHELRILAFGFGFQPLPLTATQFEAMVQFSHQEQQFTGVLFFCDCSKQLVPALLQQHERSVQQVPLLGWITVCVMLCPKLTQIFGV